MGRKKRIMCWSLCGCLSVCVCAHNYGWLLTLVLYVCVQAFMAGVSNSVVETTCKAILASWYCEHYASCQTWFTSRLGNCYTCFATRALWLQNMQMPPWSTFINWIRIICGSCEYNANPSAFCKSIIDLKKRHQRLIIKKPESNDAFLQSSYKLPQRMSSSESAPPWSAVPQVKVKSGKVGTRGDG